MTILIKYLNVLNLSDITLSKINILSKILTYCIRNRNILLMPNSKQQNSSSSLQAFACNSSTLQTVKPNHPHTLDAFLYIQNDHLYQVQAPLEIHASDLLKSIATNLQQHQNIVVIFGDLGQNRLVVQQFMEYDYMSRLLDCLCLCRKQGWPKKGISRVSECVSVSIRKQFISEKSIINIRGNIKNSVYLCQLVALVKQTVANCVGRYRKKYQSNYMSKELNKETPILQEINSHNFIMQVLRKGLGDLRIKTLYETSLAKINDQILQFESQKRQNISSLIKNIVIQSSQINSLVNKVYSQENTFLKNYGIFSVQALYCYHFLPKIFNYYSEAMKQNCTVFIKNSSIINTQLENSDYFDYLQVKKKYRLPSREHPYDRAIQQLGKLTTASTLRQMLLCAQKTFSMVKVCCLEEYSGKLEISAMDDLLPVMIYVVAKAEIQNFPVYVKLIDDYVRSKKTFELEQRIITTLYVAIEDINKKIPSLKK